MPVPIANAAAQPAENAAMPCMGRHAAVRWWQLLTRPAWGGSVPFGTGFALAACLAPVVVLARGDNVVRRSRDGIAFWAVSDLNAQELADPVRLWQAE